MPRIEAHQLSTATSAMADVMAFDEAKTRERIEARVLEEEDKRREEAKMRAERARAAELEEERARAEELERLRFEREQLELRRKLAEEKEAREKAEAKAEEERLERERMAAEEMKKLALERKRLEEERARFEAERQSLETTNSPQRSDEEAYGQFAHEAAGSSNNGYQRYQPGVWPRGEAKEDATIISELTEGYSPDQTAASNNAEARGSKIQRSNSTRSLSFTNPDEAEPATRRPERPRGMARRDSSSSRRGSLSSQDSASKCTSLKQLVSIEDVNLDDPKVMRAFLMQPCPKGEGMVQCSVRRTKGLKNALFPEYRMYLKNSSKTETFLMTSKKRGGSKTSNYLLSMNRNDHDKGSDSIVGKLRSNFLGTEYMIYDHGSNPDFDDDEKNGGEVRRELGGILYSASTSLGSKGPRQMRCCLPKVDVVGRPVKTWQPSKKDDERMISMLQEGNDRPRQARVSREQTAVVERGGGGLCFELQWPRYHGERQELPNVQAGQRRAGPPIRQDGERRVQPGRYLAHVSLSGVCGGLVEL